MVLADGRCIALLAGIAALLSSGCAKPSEAAVRRLPAGTIIEVRLQQSLDSASTRAGDEFHATVARAVTIDGQQLIPAGAVVKGYVQKSVSTTRSSDRSMIALELHAIEMNQRTLDIETHSVARVSGEKRKWSLLRVRSESDEASSARDDVHIPALTVLAFRLREAVTL